MSAFPQWTGADGKVHQYYLRTNPLTYFDAGIPLAHGVVAIKRELKYNGFGVKKFNTENLVFGLQAEQTAMDFQRSRGLVVDGQVGPKTCAALFLKRVRSEQDFRHIPDDLLAKQLQLESAWDPSARGYVDPRDRGLNQINSGAHPEVSDEEADDPAFSVSWAGQNMRSAFNDLADWDAALAANNVGSFYARKWRDAGKPASGLFTNQGKDYAKICTDYVSKVRSQTI